MDAPSEISGKPDSSEAFAKLLSFHPVSGNHHLSLSLPTSVTPSIRQCRSLSQNAKSMSLSLSIARSFLCKIQLSRVSIPEANSPTKTGSFFQAMQLLSFPTKVQHLHTHRSSNQRWPVIDSNQVINPVTDRLSDGYIIWTRISVRTLITYQPVIFHFDPVTNPVIDILSSGYFILMTRLIFKI